MRLTSCHEFLLIHFAALAVADSSEIVDLTLQSHFDEFVGQRENVWIVIFTKSAPGLPFSQLSAKLKEIIRFGRVDCSRVRSDAGHALAPCQRAASKADSVHVLGYTFDNTGERLGSARTYVGKFASDKLTKWATNLMPKLAVTLTSVAGTNVLHKTDLNKFLKQPRVSKALIFTTSSKGAPPSLVTALALRFRQRLLVGEVKASDVQLRNAFSVVAPPAIIVMDSTGGKHVYKGAFKRTPIEAFFQRFVATSPILDLHRKSVAKKQRVQVRKSRTMKSEL